MDADQRPGKELPKDIREIAVELVANQGWRYRYNGKHGMLYPADRSRPALAVPTTPSEYRGFKNPIADVRRRGGAWPPPRGKGR
jgi:hypothetical protein